MVEMQIILDIKYASRYLYKPMFDHALPLFVLHYRLLFSIEFWFFLALSKASNFVKLCIFFVLCWRCSPNKGCNYFCGMEGALFCKAMWIFFWCWKWFSCKLCHCFCHGEVVVSYKLCGFFCCVECIMEIFWFHCHSPSLLLLLHIFFISIVFFSLLSLPFLIFFCCLSLCIVINPLSIGFFSMRFWIFTWLVDFYFFSCGWWWWCLQITFVHLKINYETYYYIISSCCSNKIIVFGVNQLIANLCDFSFIFLESFLVLILKNFLFYLLSIYIFLFKLFILFCFYILGLCFSCFVSNDPIILISCYCSWVWWIL